jgi:hypothetical protein
MMGDANRRVMRVKPLGESVRDGSASAQSRSDAANGGGLSDDQVSSLCLVIDTIMGRPLLTLVWLLSSTIACCNWTAAQHELQGDRWIWIETKQVPIWGIEM